MNKLIGFRYILLYRYDRKNKTEKDIIKVFNNNEKTRNIEDSCVPLSKIHTGSYLGINIKDKPYYIVNRFGLAKNSNDKYYVVDVDKNMVIQCGTGGINRQKLDMIEMHEYDF